MAVLDPATGASSLHRVTRNMHGIKRVDWSPDGTQIAFTAGSFDFSVGTTSNLYVVDADGTGQRRVTHVARGQRVAGMDWVSSDAPFLAGFSDVGVDASNAVVVRIGPTAASTRSRAAMVRSTGAGRGRDSDRRAVRTGRDRTRRPRPVRGSRERRDRGHRGYRESRRPALRLSH